MSLKAMWADYPPASKFFFTIAVVLLSTLFFTVLSIGLASGIFGLSVLQFETLMKDFDNPLTIAVMKFVQSLSTIGTFIVPAFLLGWLFSDNTRDYLGLRKPASLPSVLIVIILFLVSTPLINYLGELNSKMHFPFWLKGVENWMRESEDKATTVIEKFLVINSPLDFLLALFMIAVLPALGEELLFRGVIQRLLSEWSRNIHIGIWSSAILFSALHMQFYGFVPRMLLGVMLGYLYVWSGTLWLPIIAHFINNAAAVILHYLFKQGAIKIDADKIGTQNDNTSILISAAITGLLLWMIYRREKVKAIT